MCHGEHQKLWLKLVLASPTRESLEFESLGLTSVDTTPTWLSLMRFSMFFLQSSTFFSCCMYIVLYTICRHKGTSECCHSQGWWPEGWYRIIRWNVVWKSFQGVEMHKLVGYLWHVQRFLFVLVSAWKLRPFFRQEESIKDLQRDCFLKLAICRPNLGCRSSDSALSSAARFGKAAMA